MEVFYNELSNKPLAANAVDARERVISLLKTLKQLREYEINIMRTHDNFYTEKVSETYQFADFFNDSSVSPTLKILLQTVVANPFIKDEETLEAGLFIENEYFTTDHSGASVSPEGLSSAFIFNSPALSFGSEVFWQKGLLSLTVKEPDGLEEKHEVVNIFSADSTAEEPFKNWWAMLNPPVPLNSEANIYSVFSSEQFIFEQRAIDDLIFWYYNDKRYLARIRELIEDIIYNPFCGGKGKTETLKGGSKASKRIEKKDRIVYSYSDNKIIIYQCRGHYEDT